MLDVRYPTRAGVAIPPFELDLPESHLDPNKIKNYNLHHGAWTAKFFGKCVLLQTMRNLEANQGLLLLDTHQWLHDTYDPPAPPTPLQALYEIERAKDNDEYMLVRDGSQFVRQKISDSALQHCIANYDSLVHRHNLRWQ